MQGWGDAGVARDEGEEVYDGGEKMCLDGIKRRYGKGIARWGLGAKEVYNGDWLYNQKHGKGERMWANGEVYNGTWTHGRMQGELGEFDKIPLPAQYSANVPLDAFCLCRERELSMVWWCKIQW